MSHPLKFLWPSMALVTTALVLSLLMSVGSCDSNVDPTKAAANTAASGTLGYAHSFDVHDVNSYSDDSMGLANKMTSALNWTEDGSIEKSRKTIMASYGSDLVNMKDISSLTGTDAKGHEYSTTYEKEVTFKGCDLLFMVLRDDLVTLSSQGVDPGRTDSKTYMLLPDIYSDEEIDAFRTAFGDINNTYIKTFAFDADITELFKDLNIDTGLYFGSFPWKEAFGAFLNKEMWDAIHDMAMNQSKPKAQIDVTDGWADWESFGGVSCRWHNVPIGSG